MAIKVGALVLPRPVDVREIDQPSAEVQAVCRPRAQGHGPRGAGQGGPRPEGESHRAGGGLPGVGCGPRAWTEGLDGARLCRPSWGWWRPSGDAGRRRSTEPPTGAEPRVGRLFSCSHVPRGARRLSVDGGFPARAASLTEPRGPPRHHAVALKHSRRLWLEPRPLGSPSRWPHTHSRNPVLGAGLQPLRYLPPRRASPRSCPRPLQLLPPPRHPAPRRGAANALPPVLSATVTSYNTLKKIESTDVKERREGFALQTVSNGQQE